MKDYGAEKKIFHHIDELFDDYHELPETREADEELKKYLKENFLDGDSAEVQKKWLELTDMVNHAEVESEQQGFIFGFRYAVELFVKGDRMQRPESGKAGQCKNSRYGIITETDSKSTSKNKAESQF